MSTGITMLAVVVASFELLVIGRVLAGASWALDFAVVMAYIAEFLPRRHQGKLNRRQGMWYVAATTNLLLTSRRLSGRQTRTRSA